MARFTESVVEDAALAWLEDLGYQVRHGPDLAVDGALRASFRTSQMDPTLNFWGHDWGNLNSTREPPRELWAERVLEWAAIAMDGDPEMAMILADDPLLWELRVQVSLMSSYAEQLWEPPR